MSQISPTPKPDELIFGSQIFHIMGDAALYWPRHKALLLADLHLEKGSSYAQNGQMLPPYDSLETLKRLEKLSKIAALNMVICLGDNFHDTGGETRIAEYPANLLRQMTAKFNWIWIIGNHDPLLEARYGGTCREEMRLDNIYLRHAADPAFSGFEISGHFHPKIHIMSNKRSISRRCFLKTDKKIIMPAFGAYTGGMDVHDAANIAHPTAIQSGKAQAILALPERLLRFPLPHNGMAAGPRRNITGQAPQINA